MFENKLRFYHTTDVDSDRSTWREVFPLGAKTYEWKKDKEEIFYRQDKKGGFIFTNYTEDGTKVNDFEFFNGINENTELRCATRFIVTEKNCDGVWTVQHIGKFSMNDCDFDIDKCIITAKQNLVDEYSCLKENKSEKFNIISSAPVVSSFSPVQNNYDFHQTRNAEFLESLNFGNGYPTDATGGWKKFFLKTATNIPEPALTYYTENLADEYSDCLLTPNHGAWIRKTNGVPDIYSLEIYRFADSSLAFSSGTLDAQSSLVVDSGMIGFTTNGLRDFKVYRPDTNTLLNIVQNHTDDILWFDIEDDEEGSNKYAFYYDDNNSLFSYDFTTGITRELPNFGITFSTEQITGVSKLNISYGDNVLVFHDGFTNTLKRYNPKNFILTTIQTVQSCKHIVSEDSFITWFNEDDSTMYLQNRDDTTFENIIVDAIGGDCGFSSRENEWIVFHNGNTGGAYAMNLINRELWFVQTLPVGTPNVNAYKIENGWFLFASSTINKRTATNLNTKIVGSNIFYKFEINVIELSPVNEEIQMSAGIERIYISGRSDIIFPFIEKTYSVDMDSQVATEIENLGSEADNLNCLKMNGCGQIISTNKNRVSITKENIQRGDELSIWFREKTATISVGNSPVQPTGSWTLLRDQTNEFGFSTWVRQPSISAPPVIDIVEGECQCSDLVPDLVVDNDECVSINPNSLIDENVMNATTSLNAGTIIGAVDGYAPLGNLRAFFYIEKPRDGSTYTWTVNGTGVIFSGQGTDVVEIDFPILAIYSITCQEVNPCEALPIPLLTQPFQRVPVGTPTLSPNIPFIVEPNTFSGATVKFVKLFENPFFAGSGQNFFGGTLISQYVDSKGRPTFEVAHDGVSAGVTANVTSGTSNSVANVPVVSTISPPEIFVSDEVCPSGLQTFGIKSPRIGCSYSWTVDSPAFIVGSNIGQTVVIDLNGSTALDKIKVSEVCPIQPVNFQLVAPCDKLNSDSWWWTIGQDVEYQNGRLLKNVVEDLVKTICPDITIIRSDFFQWNPLNPSLINYVYGGLNDYNYLTIYQKSDVVNPSATEKATIGNLTWNQFVEWMRLIEVYYVIIDNELHIEHISHFIDTVGIDTTVLPASDFANYKRQFSYDKFEMARSEEFTMMEGENAEFVGFPIEYKNFDGSFSLCVNDETKEEEFDNLTTDLKFIQTNPSNVSYEGFVILATRFDGSNYNVIQDAGIITGIPILNSPMSISSLQNRFMRYNRILKFGQMNRIYTNFETSQFFKKQKKFKIPFCCGNNFNPIQFVKTTLGTGQIESAEIDYETTSVP